MTIVFRYLRKRRPDGALRRAPCILIYARDAAGRTHAIDALVDSGADSVVIPQGLADVLGLRLGDEIETGGIGGAVRARTTTFPFVVTNGRERYAFAVPALIIQDASAPIPLILGRNGFFEHFEITFRQAEEKIMLKKVAQNRQNP